MSLSKSPSPQYTTTYQQYKPMPQVRQGDWVCIRCSNFNFSFRNTCNRCKIQTRDTNFFQFVYPSMGMMYHPNLEMEEMQSLYKETEKTYDKIESNKENNPFQSTKLHTPIKNQRQNYDSDDEPYKSPCYVPSVSPLLKKYNSMKNQNLFSNTTNGSLYEIGDRIRDIFVSEFNGEDNVIDGDGEDQEEGKGEREYQIEQLLASIDL